MDRKPVYGDRWSESSLERSGRMAQEVYGRALSRRVTWSPPVKRKFHPREEDCADVPFNEAFMSMVSCLHQASRACQKYHTNKELVKGYEDSVEHCQRFHKRPQTDRECYTGNPLQAEGRVHLTLPEGAYAITAHKPATGASKTNIVQLSSNGSLSLNFTL
ncbi:uncharacterized protein LOC143297752 [Babylonia areolata]|uniref:uncharacterized protein LOC143297752 n=1 Tax=Babylonia areolata TaxID=304850 RepID=UPI003FD37866